MKKILLSLFVLAASSKLSAQACTGAPAANTAVASSTNICPGNSVTLTLQNAYTATGIVYQWASSTTSSIGPWAQISGANNSSLVTTAITQSGWYTAVIACSNSFMTTTATAVYINVGSAAQTTTAPYYESFENPVPNGLPNCGWTASSLGANCLSIGQASANALPYTGTRMLAFSYSATALGPHEFYTNGFNLNAGVTYSVKVAQTTNNYFPSNNWSQFGIGVGPSQSAAGGNVVYSTNNPNTGPYAIRSATFTVPSNGVYYIRIFANSVVGTVIGQYLTFDALELTAPCNIGNNMGNALLSTTANIGPTGLTICQGDSALVNFLPMQNCVMVSPASGTAFVHTSTVSMPPQAPSFTYAVTNTLTGCANLYTLSVFSSPHPSVFALSNPSIICAGQVSYITGLGALNYTLMPGALTGLIYSVTPNVSSTYTVIGKNNFSCTATATVNIVVNPKPNLNLSADTVKACAGESASVTVSGASSYTSNFAGAGSQGGIFTFPSISTSTAAVIIGTSAQQCTNSVTVQLKVDQCAGISQQHLTEHLKLVPNPAHDFISITYTDGLEAKLYNLQGQLIQKDVFTNAQLNLDVRKCAPGIYYLVLTSATAINTVKIVVE